MNVIAAIIAFAIALLRHARGGPRITPAKPDRPASEPQGAAVPAQSEENPFSLAPATGIHFVVDCPAGERAGVRGRGEVGIPSHEFLTDCTTTIAPAGKGAY